MTKPVQPASPPLWSRNFRSLMLLIIVICAIVPYLRALEGEFVWTDKHFIEDNASLQDWSTLPGMFVQDAWNIGGEARRIGYYRPIRNLTFLLDTKLFGTEPIGYHVTNLLLHAACSLLVFGVVARTLGRQSLAAWAAVLFAVHPVHTEAVAWITGRTDSVSAFGYLAALYCWLRAYGERTQWGWWLLGCIAAAAGLLAKESAATMCAILALLLWLRNAPRDRSLPLLILRCTPPVVLTVAYLAARSAVLSSLTNHGPWGGTWESNALTGVSLLAPYVRLLARGGPLVAVYEEHVRTSIQDPVVLAGIAIVIVVLVLALLHKRFPVAALAGVWTVVTLTPVLQIVPFKVLLAERFLYLPSVGWCVLLGAAINWVIQRQRLVGGAVGIACIGYYGILTVQRVPFWHDDIVLFRDSLAKHPNSFEARTELGEAYLDLNQPTEAYREFRHAKDLRPDYYLAWYNLGLADQRSIRSQGATFNFQMAATLRPELTDLWYAYANSAYAEGDFVSASRGFATVAERLPTIESLTWLLRSLALSDQWDEAVTFLNNLPGQKAPSPALDAEGGYIYARSEEQSKAETWLARARALEADALEVLQDDLQTFASRGDMQTALHIYRVVLALRPDDWPLLVGAIDMFRATEPGATFLMARDFAIRHPEHLGAMVTYVRLALEDENPEAVTAGATLLERHPDSAVAHGTAARVRRATGDLAGAIAAAELAFEIDPAYTEAWLLHGELLFQTGDFDGAAASLEEVLERIPDSLTATQLLARAYAGAGRQSDAENLVRDGLKRFPDDPQLLSLAEDWDLIADER